MMTTAGAALTRTLRDLYCVCTAVKLEWPTATAQVVAMQAMPLIFFDAMSLETLMYGAADDMMSSYRVTAMHKCKHTA